MDYDIKNFKDGTVNRLEAESIPDGSASDSLNWLTMGDIIEVRRGSKIIGTLINGNGKITGWHKAMQSNGTEIFFMSQGKKVYYYNSTTLLFVEIGTDILGAAAEDEDVAFADYNSLAGDAMYFSSPNSSLFKVMLANPGSYTDIYDSTKNYKGYITIKNNRMWLWNTLKDKTGIYLSKIATDTAIYTSVSSEGTTSLSGTLAFKAGGAKRTCFNIVITQTVSGEVFTDNYDGTLTGSLGNTGTINYTSGAYTISIAGVGTASYQWVNDTVGGIADFTYSATRIAGEGDIIRQDDGGRIQTIKFYGDSAFCLHQYKTWELTLTADDTSATNEIYREKVGVDSWKGAVDTGDGIYLIDTSVSNDPTFRLLTFGEVSDKVTPVEVTKNFDFSDYYYDDAYLDEFGDYIMVFCRTLDSSSNNRVIVYNKTWKTIDVLDYYGRCGGIYNGAFYVGDSVTDNVWELFSGFDDDDAGITNYWAGNFSKLGQENLKRTKRLRVRGLIQSTMNIGIYIDLDNSGFSLVGTIAGDGSYVDVGTPIYVGANTIGSKEVGGGGDGVYAYRYVYEVALALGKFHDIKIKFVADSDQIGYASVSEINYLRVLNYTNKRPTKYS